MKRLGIALLIFLGLASAVLGQAALVTPMPQAGNIFNALDSATFTTSASTATLSGATGKWTYICGFVVTSTGTTPVNAGNITVTGTVSKTMNYEYVFVNSGQGVLGIAFGPGCIQSSAQNTNIVVNVPGSGGSGTAGAVTAWGFTN